MNDHRIRKLFGVLVAATLVFSACGSDPAPLVAPAAADAAPADPDPSASGEASRSTVVAVTAGESEVGDILIGADGLALYGFTNDVDATSACYGTCAEAWPPLIVDENWDVAPGLDSGIFNAVARDDGQLQLVAGKWPLYAFAGDTTETDLNGQGSGGVWFAVGTDGALITDAEVADSPTATDGAPAIVSVATTSLGDALVNEAGLTLYGFLDDVDGTPTCEAACADAWPPILVPSGDLPADLDPAVFSVSERADGTFQLTSGVWPLYLFAGDGEPGDVNGQGSGDVWFVAAPDGGLIGLDDSAENAAATDSSDY